MGLTNPQPEPLAIVNNAELSPFDPAFIEDIKYVHCLEVVPTRETIATEVIKKRTHVSPENFDKFLQESVPNALVRAFHPDSETNDTKDAIMKFVLSEKVAGRIAQTFINLEVMQTAI